MFELPKIQRAPGKARKRPVPPDRPTPPVHPAADQSARAVRALTRLSALLAALAVGAVALAVVVSVSAQARSASLGGDTLTVCVTNGPLEAGTVIESSMVSETSVPAQFAAEGAVKSAGDAVGKLLVSPISANSQVTNANLATPDNALSLAAALEPGYRGLSIAVDAQSGLAGLIRHGNRVDVLAEGTRIVEGAKVLAVDASLDETLSEYATVTVQVTETDAVAVQAAQERTPVQLAMCPTADSLAESEPE